jgi:hypothetical protein
MSTYYERRVRALEDEGMTRSDAQAVADAQDMQTKEQANSHATGGRTKVRFDAITNRSARP